MKKERLLLVLHYPPPIHGAAMMGDIIRKSEKLKEEFETRCIKIDSSDELGDIGRISIKKIWLTLRFIFRVFWIVIIFRPNKVHYFSSSQGIAFYRDYLASIFFKLLQIFNGLSIYYHYEAKYRLGKSWEKTIAKWYFENASIVVMSKELINDFKVLPFWKNLTFYTLPNTCKDLITDKEFSTTLSSKEKTDSVTFLYLSNMIASKGYLEVLDVASYLNKKGMNAQFSFAGGWVNETDERDFLQRVKSESLEHMIRIHGRVDDKQKKELLSRSHFLIFPTRYPNEAFPLVLIEAMQFGVLPITYSNGATPSIVTSDFGWLIADNSISSLKKAAKEAAKRENYIDKSKLARKKYLNEYKLGHFEKRLVSILKLEVDPYYISISPVSK